VPEVSVVLPMYNVARFVREAAGSVLTQSWRDLELIAVDDGSTDSTAREIEQIADPRVVLLRQDHRGAAAARNTALHCARGRYIAFVDGDDVWLPGKLEQDVAYLAADPETNLVFSTMRMVDESGRDLGRTIRKWSGTLTLRDLLIENRIPTPTVVMRSEAVRRAGWFDEELPVSSDFEYWLRVSMLGTRSLHGRPQVTALYRTRAGQVSSNWQRRLQVRRKIMTKMRVLYPDLVSEVERLTEAGYHRALAATAYENGEIPAALKLFRRGMRHAPAFLLADKRTWFLGSALLSACLLPRGAHGKLEQFARTARASWL